MRKFTFLRKKIQAKDRSLQEKLVNSYFDNLKLNDELLDGQKTSFDQDGVYSRITQRIDAPILTSKTQYKKWMVAASFFIVASISALIFYYRINVLNVISPIAQKEFVAKDGRIASLTLADGTKVWLNGGSKLSYPEKFRGDKREITLVGEGFFDVVHDANKAFIVHTGNIKTHVLGTSFNIKAYPEDAFIKVDVATGKVGVVPSTAETVFLTPAQQVVVYKKSYKTITASGVDIQNQIGWKDGEFVVKNMPLPDVLNTIKHRYNVRINADSNLLTCSISANFTNVSLQNIIKIISKIVKGKVVADGDGYQLKGKGC